MTKRIIASTVGTLAVLAGLVAFAFGIEGTEDFTSADVPWRLVIVGELLMFSMAVAALGLGTGLLQFGWTGRTSPHSSWVKPILLGIGFFFPGFVFSLPLTMLWANHAWPGEAQTGLAAAEVSVYIGIGAAIICGIVLFKRRSIGNSR